MALFTAERLGRTEELEEMEERCIADASARWFDGLPLARVEGWLEEAP